MRRPLALVLALVLLGSLLVVVPPGGGVPEAEAQSVSAAGAVLHRTEIVEGQERNFQISNIPSYPAYYLRIKALNSPYTAEAGDLMANTRDLRGRAQAIGPGSDGPQAYVLATSYNRMTFEVEANTDGDTDDETFGVQLCTTASCTGGTILGDWTVTITEPAADTTLSGTNSTVTISGGSAVSMMEVSSNGDRRDNSGTFEIHIPTALTADVVIVAKADTSVVSGLSWPDNTPVSSPIAQIAGSASRDNGSTTGEYIVARLPSGWSGTDKVTVGATNNIVDSAGGSISGNLVFRVLNDNAAYSDGTPGNATVYSGVTIPDVPIAVTHDDEPTRVKVLAASSADNEATEGSSTDTAKFRVMLERALAASEEVTVPLRFSGAALGTNFTLALDGSPTGASYADSSDGTEGRLTFSGAGAQEATVVVTAISDSDSVSESLGVFIPQYSDPWRANYIDAAGLDGGACAGRACPGVGSGDAPERGYQITLREASPGLTVIDTGDRRVDEGGTYSYTVRLNTAPSANVTVAVSSGATSAATVTTGGSLTFTPSGGSAWNVPQTVTIAGAANNTDAADASVAITHDVSGSGTYASIADVMHDLIVVDDDATTVTMSGAGLRTSSSSTNISEVMVEGDTTRVDRSLTITLSRPLEAGEYVKVPLYLEATGHPATPYVECDITGTDVPPDNWNNCEVISSPRGVRVSASVSWPPHYNDFVMTATGTGVSYQHVPRTTFNHNGYRYIEFRGAGAQTATIEMHARGFDDRDTHDEKFRIEFANDFQPLNPNPSDGRFAYSLKPLTNLGGGIEAWAAGAEAWFGIADDEGGGVNFVVPADWSLLPTGLTPGDTFRLIYVTSQTMTANTADLSTFDRFVRAEITGNDLVSGGVTDMIPYAASFKAIAENWGRSARNQAEFDPGNSDHPNVPIYWVGGSKVADDNADFTDTTWDDEANPRHADGTAATINASGYWTGSSEDGDGQPRQFNRCTRGSGYPGNPMFGQNRVAAGYLNSGAADENPLGYHESRTGTVGVGPCKAHSRFDRRPMYALSSTVFEVVGEVGIEGGSAAEGSPVTFTVSRPEAESDAVTVSYTISDGLGISTDPDYIVATGAAGGTNADYTNDFTGVGSVVIPANMTSGTFSVPTTQDSDYESDHYFTVTLTGASGTHGINSGKATATGVIEDDADAPTIGFSAATASVAENVTAGTVSLTVERSSGSDVPAAVTWTTADGTGGSGASHPGDYTADTGIIEFAAGETSKTIAIDIVDDDTEESAETFTVVLSDPVDATLGSQASATVTVTDDDGGADVLVTWSNTDDTALERAPDLIEGQTLTVKVSLASPAPVGGVVIPIGVMDFTTNRNGTTDYTVPSSVTIAAGETSATFDVAAFADDLLEDDELFRLTLCPTASCPAGYTSGGTPPALDPIIRDPTVVTDFSALGVDDPVQTVVHFRHLNEGASGTFTIALELDPVVDATVTVFPVDGDATAVEAFDTAATASAYVAVDTDPDTPGNQTTLTFTGGNGGNWNVAQTVTVYALYDEDVDTDDLTGTDGTDETADRYTIVLLTNAASGPYDEPVNTYGERGVVTILDAGKAVVVDPATVSVAASGTVTYDLQLASDPGGSVTVTPTSGDATKATVTGEAKTFTSSGATAWNVAQQVTVTGVAVGASTITHAITTGTTDYPTSGSGVTLPSVAVTVTAAPTVPEVTIAANAATATEGVDTPGFTVTAAPAPTGTNTITVNVNLSGAADYGSADRTVMLPIDSLGTIGLTIDLATTGDDAVDEPNGTWTATIQAATDGSYTVGSPNTAMVTLIDDDPTVVSLARVDSGNIAEGGSGNAADAEFTVTLGRNLVAGETVEVPLVLSGGSNVIASDVMVAAKSGVTNHGVMVGSGGTLTPTVTFMGHATNTVQTATLTLVASADSTAGEAAETITVALGPNDNTANGFDASARATNVGGGADPSGTANTFNVGVDADTAVASPVTVAMAKSGGDGDGNPVENAGDSTEYVTITLTLGRNLTSGESVTVPLTVVGATVTDDYTFALQPSSQTGVSLSTSGAHSAQNLAVVFSGTTVTSATLRLTPVDNSDRSQPFVVIDYNDSPAPTTGGGATSGGPIGLVLVDDESGEILVPADWALKPSGVGAAETFRLLFVTSESRDAQPTDIDVYNEWVQNLVARNGHASLLPYGGLVKVVGSTSATAARVNVGMYRNSMWADGSTNANSAGIAIYWLAAPSTNKVADNYFDFYDGDWDGGARQDQRDTIESGAARTGTGNEEIWTGSERSGSASTQSLGSLFVGTGRTRVAGADNGPLDTPFAASDRRTSMRPFYVLSPVFKVDGTPVPPELSFASATYSVAENVSSGTVDIVVNASAAPSAALTVNLTTADGTATGGGVDYTAPGATFTFPANQTSHTISVAIANDLFYENDTETFTLTLTASTESPAPYTVGSPAATTVTINDEDTVTVSIADTAITVLEDGLDVASGSDDSGTADGGVDILLQVERSDIPVFVTLTPADGTATGASGGTGADFDSDAITRIGFIQSILVELPITGDSSMEADEKFEVALTVDAGQPRVSLGSTSTLTVTIADDDNLQGLLFDPPIADGIEVPEAGSATYTVRPTTLPTGNVVVTITGAGSGITVDADGSGGNALTFTPTNWYIAQTVTLAAAADDGNNMNEMITLAHAPVGGGYTVASHSGSYVAEAQDDDVTTPVTVTMSAAGGNSDGDVVENASDGSEYVTLTISLDRALAASETTSVVTVPLVVAGATVGTDYTLALEPSTQTGVSLSTSGSYSAQNPAVLLSGVGAQTATLRFTAVNNSARSQPAISITYGMVSATGTTLAGSEGAPITFSIVDDETGAIVVPADWALKPSGVAAGEEFRLIFITSEERTAESTDIENYNDWAQELVARGGHAELQKYGGLVKVLGSTASTDASENLGMHDGTDYEDDSTSDTDSGVAIYWLAAPPTNKVADNYFDFFDRSWDGGASGGSDQTSEATIESGAARSAYTQILSGTQTDGRADSTSPLGGTRVWIGETDGGNGGAVIFTGASTLPNTDSERMLAMSPVFQVEAAAAPVVSVELVAVEGARTPTGEVAFGEGEGGITPINFPVTADPAPTANLTVCVQVAESGHGGVDRVAASAEGIQTVTITSSGSVEHMVAYSNTAVDEPDSIVTVTVLAPETVGCSATAGSYTVSTTNPSDKARIVDDEPTVAELTSSDMIMVEGIPAGTAEVTVSLARRLYEGEVMEIELRLSTATGAVLPHVASPDFTVSSATGSGVALSDATTAAAAPDDAQTAPKVTFTGDNANTVQTATVTFAPTAGRDSDSMDETITVSLAPSLTLVGAAGSNVGGGATRHASNYMVDLTLAEAVAVSVSELRVAENGGAASYEVRLLTAPSGGDTTVTIGKVNGTGVNPDTTAATLTDKDGNVVSTLTFTSTDFSDAQVITVTGVDELSVFDMANDSPTYRDRSLQLTHTASGGGYSSQSLGDIDVVVQEAPQIEVYSGRISTAETPGPYRNGLPARHTLGVALQTDVFSTMDFFVRASDRPVGGEPITVTLSVASTYTQEDLSSVRPRSSDRGPLNSVNGSVIGMQLTRSSPVVQSLTLTFEDRPIGPEGCGILFNDNGEMGDGTPDSSFECPRIVYLVKTNPAFVHGCQDIDVTVSGGSVRTGGVYDPESITVHFWNGNHQIINDAGGGYKSACAWDSVVPRWSSPRPEPRTEYCVLGGRFVSPTTRSCFHFVDSLPSLDENSDVGWAPDNAQLVPEGSNTRYEIDLGVQVQRGQSYELELKPYGATMGDDYTLSLDTENSPHVSVDPNHPLDSATPRLIFSPGARVASIIVEVLDDTEHERELLTIGYGEYRYKTVGHSDKVTYPQTRVRFAFIDSTIPVPTQPVSNLAVTADDAATASASWNKVLGATAYNVSYQGNGVDPLNDVSGAVHGLSDTTFTFAHHAAEQMVVTVTVTPVHRASDGTTTVFHALSSSADLDLANPMMTCVPPWPGDAVTVEEVTRWLFAHTESKSHVLRWNRVLAALGEDTGETPLTVAESRVNEGRFQQSRWDRVTRTLEALEQCATPPTPVISITADGDITEGGDATFTLTANPAPTGPLDVEVSVTASGDYGVSAASHTVTIATTGAGTLTITTSGDSVDEADGSVTATITDGTAYDVSTTAGTATVAVSDDDAPQISIASDGDITEGGDATFTLTANPAPAAPLDVDVSVTQTGDYGVTAGSRTVTISTGGTGTLTVTTSGDSVDEPDGSVTVTVTDGTVYDVSATAGSATVAVSDDDIPQVSITADGDVTEGGDATFTLTASPVPSASLDVTVSVTQTGDYGVTAGSRTVTVSTGGTGTLTVATSDDSADEPDGSVTATVDAGSGYTVSSAAGAATVAVADDDAAACTPNLPSDAVTVSEVTGWRDGHSGAAHVLRWNRVLEALGVDTGVAAMTVEESRDNEGTFMASRWDRVTRTLEAIEQCHNPPPPTPEVSITAGGDITEGGDATFTLTATPAPTAPLDVDVTVAQSGDYGVASATHTVTITTGGAGTLTVTTSDDSVDEADGSVTATVDAGSGYTVSSTAGTASVAVADDDAAVCVPQLPSDAVTVSEVTGWRDGHSGAAHVLRWNRVLEALGVDTGTGATAMTVEESRDNEGTFMASRWDRVTRTLEAIKQCDDTTTTVVPPPPPPPPPVVSITADGDITEGGDATFTLTANPAPTAPLDVDVSVTASGDYGVTTGSRTVTIATGGTGTLTISTDDDSADETDGSVTAAIDDGADYDVSATAGTATVTVADDDAPAPPPPATPVVSITADGDITEGGDATFTLTANPAPTAPLDVDVSVTASGDFGVTPGSQTVTIPTSGSLSLTITTSDDSADEADGSVTVAIDDGAAYTVSSTAGAATAAIADDDAPPPPPPPATPVVSITADGDITEGGDATFTLTANPAPTADLDVTVSVTQNGDFGVTTGSQTVTIATGGTGTLTISTDDDSADETDGSVTVTIDDGAAYTVSSTAAAATAAIADDDPASVRLPPNQVSFSVEDASATEGETLSFRVMLSNAASARVRVWWTTRYGGGEDRAFPGRDYPKKRGWLAFAPGETEKWVEIPLSDDSANEPSEVFQIYLGFTEGGATIADRDGTMTIIDND